MSMSTSVFTLTRLSRNGASKRTFKEDDDHYKWSDAIIGLVFFAIVVKEAAIFIVNPPFISVNVSERVK